MPYFSMGHHNGSKAGTSRFVRLDDNGNTFLSEYAWVHFVDPNVLGSLLRYWVTR